MGMTYEQLDEFGKLRKIERAGPLSMFEHLLLKWGPHQSIHKKMTPRQIADKVKLFFKHYA
jgi:NAD+ synthase (glutamine-hydrolysing)